MSWTFTRIRSLSVGGLALTAAFLFSVSCSGGGSSAPRDGARARDAAGDVAPLSGGGRDLTLLPLLPGYGQSLEPHVAAYGRRVVVSAINLAVSDPNAWEETQTIARAVVAWSSQDGGKSFTAPVRLEPQGETTDPVAAVDEAGRFWIASFLFSEVTAPGLLFTSEDATTWLRVPTPEAFVIGDKEWITVDRAGAWVSGIAGTYRVTLDGGTTRLGDGGLMAAAYTAPEGPSFLEVHSNAEGGHAMIRVREGALLQEPGDRLPVGNAARGAAIAGAAGRLSDGREWIVRTVESGGMHRIALRVRAPGSLGSDVFLSPPSVQAFLPAAALDSASQLHGVWYEDGKVVYRRFDLTRPVEAIPEAIVVDDAACPGGGWRPLFDAAVPGSRRLREYIGIAATNERVHMAWTHAPVAPPRVYTAWLPSR